MFLSNRIVEKQLDRHIRSLERVTDADVLTFVGPISPPMDDVIREAVEHFDPHKKRLVVILETSGGVIEVVERIVTTFRQHYGTVEFIVPKYAMSAGTVLVLSGDEIYMDYYSLLGPIDPQVRVPERGLIPALGYLEQYNRLIRKSQKGTITSAELAYLIRKFDPAELYKFEQAKELSVTLVREWLVKYKFKNWKKTESRGMTVTAKMREKRADDIARKLQKTDLWRSHGRGIPIGVLVHDLNLKIKDFGQMPELNREIRKYVNALDDYMTIQRLVAGLHKRGLFIPLLRGD